jgi:hypothetical protein
MLNFKNPGAMNTDNISPTPEELAATFKESFREYGFGDNYNDAELLQLAGICLDYGIKDKVCIVGIMKCALDFLLVGLFGWEWPLGEFGKNLATLARIFGYGKGITIQATMPEHETIIVKIENTGLLKREVFFCLNSLLNHYGQEYELEGLAERKEAAKADDLPMMESFLLDDEFSFKKPYSDMELANIIEYESGRMAYEKAMMGRPNKSRLKLKPGFEIPKLGYMVHSFTEAGGDGLASLAPIEKYCLIGDLMLAAGCSPVEQVEWEKVLTNKEKADLVQYWEESYIKVVNRKR